MVPDRIKAVSRVKRPMVRRTPPTSSISPAAPPGVSGEALFIGPAGKFRYLPLPCWRIKRPVMMRSRLKSCARNGRRNAMARLPELHLGPELLTRLTIGSGSGSAEGVGAQQNAARVVPALWARGDVIGQC